MLHKNSAPKISVPIVTESILQMVVSFPKSKVYGLLFEVTPVGMIVPTELSKCSVPDSILLLKKEELLILRTAVDVTLEFETCPPRKTAPPSDISGNPAPFPEVAELSKK